MPLAAPTAIVKVPVRKIEIYVLEDGAGLIVEVYLAYPDKERNLAVLRQALKQVLEDPGPNKKLLLPQTGSVLKK